MILSLPAAAPAIPENCQLDVANLMKHCWQE